MQKFVRKSISWLAVLGVGLLAVFLVWTQRLNVYDWWRLRNYKPSDSIVALANNDTMSDLGRKLFYVHDPQIKGRDSFSTVCPSAEQSIVLGCYISHMGIYLFDVTDERLAGVEEVTAGHEMLHAAYGRLSNSERTHIDELTKQAFTQVTDQRVIDTIERYRANDASSVPNELHSILATEVDNLPQELEDYYSRYFTDRSKVVAYAKRYADEFTRRKQQVDAYDAQLEVLRVEIEKDQDDLVLQQAALKYQRQQLDDLLAAKEYDTYNSYVPGFNTLVRNFNAKITAVQAKIDRYNQMVKDRNAIALEEEELSKALDSRIQTEAAH